MTPEERIAQLEAEVRSLRLVNEAQAIALRAANERLLQEGQAARTLQERKDAARLKKQRQRALKGMGVGDGRSDVSLDTRAVMSPGLSPGLSRDNEGTTPPSSSSPFPSSFPPSPAPSSPYPLSFPPSSPPSPIPPASQAALLDVAEQLQKPAKRTKAPRQPVGDPRHAPLSLALVGLGWPHHGGRTAKALTSLLALADQVPATAGDKAQAEVLRRAAAAKASTKFPLVRELHELAERWGHFAAPAEQPRPSILPRADDPDWETV